MKKLSWNEQFAIAWAKMAPPARPNQAEQRFYERIIQQVIRHKKKAKILILGSTPEFRDVLLKNKIKPVCCDISYNNFKILRKLMKHRGPEQFILSDWLKFRSRNSFDLILGHQVFNVIPFAKHQLFSKLILDNLRPGGLFVHSIVVRARTSPSLNLLSGFKRYRRVIKRGQRSSFFSFLDPDVLLAMSSKNGIFIPKEGRTKVDKLFQKKLITQDERNKYFDVMPASDLRVYVPKQKTIEKMMKKYFTILQAYYYPTEHYDSKYWPVYILKK